MMETNYIMRMMMDNDDEEEEDDDDDDNRVIKRKSSDQPLEGSFEPQIGLQGILN